MNKAIQRIIVSLFFLLMIPTGCKKSTEKPPIVFEINYSGSLSSFHRIGFNSTAPAGSTYSWEFGDGATSSDSSPVHVYNRSGLFSVQLVINSDANHRVKKDLSIMSTVQKMNGLYDSVFLHYDIKQSVHWPVDHSDSRFYLWEDYSYTLGVVNDSLLNLTTTIYNLQSFTEQYKLVDSLNSDSTITFCNGSWEYVTYKFDSSTIYVDVEQPGDSTGTYYYVDVYRMKQ